MQQSNNRKGSLIKQIYLFLVGTQPRVGWKCLLSKNTATPKAFFILWLMLHRKLSTTDRLTKWGLDVPKICVLCLLITYLSNAHSPYVYRIYFLCGSSGKPFHLQIRLNFYNGVFNMGKGNRNMLKFLNLYILAKCVYGLLIEGINKVFVKMSKFWKVWQKS